MSRAQGGYEVFRCRLQGHLCKELTHSPRRGTEQSHKRGGGCSTDAQVSLHPKPAQHGGGER